MKNTLSKIQNFFSRRPATKFVFLIVFFSLFSMGMMYLNKISSFQLYLYLWPLIGFLPAFFINEIEEKHANEN